MPKSNQTEILQNFLVLQNKIEAFSKILDVESASTQGAKPLENVSFKLSHNIQSVLNIVKEHSENCFRKNEKGEYPEIDSNTLSGIWERYKTLYREIRELNAEISRNPLAHALESAGLEFVFAEFMESFEGMAAADLELFTDLVQAGQKVNIPAYLMEKNSRKLMVDPDKHMDQGKISENGLPLMYEDEQEEEHKGYFTETADDKTRVAVSAVADLLGIGKTVPRTQVVTLKNGEQEVTGTFTEKTEGKTIGQLAGKSKGINYASLNQTSCIKDLLSLQTLDYLCGISDRTPSMLQYVTSEDGKEITGIRGIIRDGFTTEVPDETKDSKTTMRPKDLIVIPFEIADNLSTLDENVLDATLKNNGLNAEERSAVANRLKKLKKAMENEEVKSAEDDELEKYNFEMLSKTKGKNLFKTLKSDFANTLKTSPKEKKNNPEPSFAKAEFKSEISDVIPEIKTTVPDSVEEMVQNIRMELKADRKKAAHVMTPEELLQKMEAKEQTAQVKHWNEIRKLAREKAYDPNTSIAGELMLDEIEAYIKEKLTLAEKNGAALRAPVTISSMEDMEPDVKVPESGRLVEAYLPGLYKYKAVVKAYQNSHPVTQKAIDDLDAATKKISSTVSAMLGDLDIDSVFNKDSEYLSVQRRAIKNTKGHSPLLNNDSDLKKFSVYTNRLDKIDSLFERSLCAVGLYLKDHSIESLDMPTMLALDSISSFDCRSTTDLFEFASDHIEGTLIDGFRKIKPYLRKEHTEKREEHFSDNAKNILTLENMNKIIIEDEYVSDFDELKEVLGRMKESKLLDKLVARILPSEEMVPPSDSESYARSLIQKCQRLFYDDGKFLQTLNENLQFSRCYEMSENHSFQSFYNRLQNVFPDSENFVLDDETRSIVKELERTMPLVFNFALDAPGTKKKPNPNSKKLFDIMVQIKKPAKEFHFDDQMLPSEYMELVDLFSENEISTKMDPLIEEFNTKLILAGNSINNINKNMYIDHGDKTYTFTELTGLIFGDQHAEAVPYSLRHAWDMKDYNKGDKINLGPEESIYQTMIRYKQLGAYLPIIGKSFLKDQDAINRAADKKTAIDTNRKGTFLMSNVVNLQAHDRQNSPSVERSYATDIFPLLEKEFWTVDGKMKEQEGFFNALSSNVCFDERARNFVQYAAEKNLDEPTYIDGLKDGSLSFRTAEKKQAAITAAGSADILIDAVWKVLMILKEDNEDILPDGDYSEDMVKPVLMEIFNGLKIEKSVVDAAAIDTIIHIIQETYTTLDPMTEEEKLSSLRTALRKTGYMQKEGWNEADRKRALKHVEKMCGYYHLDVAKLQAKDSKILEKLVGIVPDEQIDRQEAAAADGKDEIAEREKRKIAEKEINKLRWENMEGRELNQAAEARNLKDNTETKPNAFHKFYELLSSKVDFDEVMKRFGSESEQKALALVKKNLAKSNEEFGKIFQFAGPVEHDLANACRTLEQLATHLYSFSGKEQRTISTLFEQIFPGQKVYEQNDRKIISYSKLQEKLSGNLEAFLDYFRKASENFDGNDNQIANELNEKLTQILDDLKYIEAHEFNMSEVQADSMLQTCKLADCLCNLYMDPSVGTTEIKNYIDNLDTLLRGSAALFRKNESFSDRSVQNISEVFDRIGNGRVADLNRLYKEQLTDNLKYWGKLRDNNLKMLQAYVKKEKKGNYPTEKHTLRMESLKKMNTPDLTVADVHTFFENAAKEDRKDRNAFRKQEEALQNVEVLKAQQEQPMPDEKQAEAEKVRLEKEHTEKEEKERLDKERIEKDKKEKEEKERAEKEAKERLERERIEKEKQEKAEKERAEKEEKERLEKERLEKEKQEKEEKERLEKEAKERAEKEEKERLEKERLENEKKQAEAEKERLEKERLAVAAAQKATEKVRPEQKPVEKTEEKVRPEQKPVEKPEEKVRPEKDPVEKNEEKVRPDKELSDIEAERVRLAAEHREKELKNRNSVNENMEKLMPDHQLTGVYQNSRRIEDRLTALQKICREKTDLDDRFVKLDSLVGVIERFKGELRNFNDRSEKYFTKDNRGNYPEFDSYDVTRLLGAYHNLNLALDDFRKELSKEAYRKAMNNTGLDLVLNQDLDELSTMMEKDVQLLTGLNTTENRSLPEALNAVRTRKISIDHAQIPGADGMRDLNFRMTFTDEKGKVHTGYFKEEQKNNYKDTIQLRVKEVLDSLKQEGYPQVVLDALQGYYAGLDKEEIYTDAEKTKAFLDKMPESILKGENSALILKALTKKAKTPQEALKKISNTLLGQDLSAVFNKNKASLGLLRSYGSSISQRESAVSAVANLLGIGQIVQHAENMNVNINGQETAGVFTEETNSDSASLAEIQASGNRPFENESCMKDLATIQILDYLCNNTDRRLSGFSYTLSKDKKSITHIQGKNNEFSFGTMVPHPVKDQAHPFAGNMVPLNDLKVIPSDLAETLSELDDTMLDRTLSGFDLSEQEISAAKGRLKQLKGAIADGTLKQVDDAAFEKLKVDELINNDSHKNLLSYRNIFSTFDRSFKSYITLEKKNAGNRKNIDAFKTEYAADILKDAENQIHEAEINSEQLQTQILTQAETALDAKVNNLDPELAQMLSQIGIHNDTEDVKLWENLKKQAVQNKTNPDVFLVGESLLPALEAYINQKLKTAKENGMKLRDPSEKSVMTAGRVINKKTGKEKENKIFADVPENGQILESYLPGFYAYKEYLAQYHAKKLDEKRCKHYAAAARQFSNDIIKRLGDLEIADSFRTDQLFFEAQAKMYDKADMKNAGFKDSADQKKLFLKAQKLKQIQSPLERALCMVGLYLQDHSVESITEDTLKAFEGMNEFRAETKKGLYRGYKTFDFEQTLMDGLNNLPYYESGEEKDEPFSEEGSKLLKTANLKPDHKSGIHLFQGDNQFGQMKSVLKYMKEEGQLDKLLEANHQHIVTEASEEQKEYAKTLIRQCQELLPRKSELLKNLRNDAQFQVCYQMAEHHDFDYFYEKLMNVKTSDEEFVYSEKTERVLKELERSMSIVFNSQLDNPDQVDDQRKLFDIMVQIKKPAGIHHFDDKISAADYMELVDLFSENEISKKLDPVVEDFNTQLLSSQNDVYNISKNIYVPKDDALYSFTDLTKKVFVSADQNELPFTVRNTWNMEDYNKNKDDEKNIVNMKRDESVYQTLIRYKQLANYLPIVGKRYLKDQEIINKASDKQKQEAIDHNRTGNFIMSNVINLQSHDRQNSPAVERTFATDVIPLVESEFWKSQDKPKEKTEYYNALSSNVCFDERAEVFVQYAEKKNAGKESVIEASKDGSLNFRTMEKYLQVKNIVESSDTFEGALMKAIDAIMEANKDVLPHNSYSADMVKPALLELFNGFDIEGGIVDEQALDAMLRKFQDVYAYFSEATEEEKLAFIKVDLATTGFAWKPDWNEEAKKNALDRAALLCGYYRLDVKKLLEKDDRTLEKACGIPSEKELKMGHEVLEAVREEDVLAAGKNDVAQNQKIEQAKEQIGKNRWAEMEGKQLNNAAEGRKKEARNVEKPKAFHAIFDDLIKNYKLDEIIDRFEDSYTKNAMRIVKENLAKPNEEFGKTFRFTGSLEEAELLEASQAVLSAANDRTRYNISYDSANAKTFRKIFPEKAPLMGKRKEARGVTVENQEIKNLSEAIDRFRTASEHFSPDDRIFAEQVIKLMNRKLDDLHFASEHKARLNASEIKDIMQTITCADSLVSLNFDPAVDDIIAYDKNASFYQKLISHLGDPHSIKTDYVDMINQSSVRDGLADPKKRNPEIYRENYHNWVRDRKTLTEKIAAFAKEKGITSFDKEKHTRLNDMLDGVNVDELNAEQMHRLFTEVPVRNVTDQAVNPAQNKPENVRNAEQPAVGEQKNSAEDEQAEKAKEEAARLEKENLERKEKEEQAKKTEEEKLRRAREKVQREKEEKERQEKVRKEEAERQKKEEEELRQELERREKIRLEKEAEERRLFEEIHKENERKAQERLKKEEWNKKTFNFDNRKERPEVQTMLENWKDVPSQEIIDHCRHGVERIRTLLGILDQTEFSKDEFNQLDFYRETVREALKKSEAVPGQIDPSIRESVLGAAALLNNNIGYIKSISVHALREMNGKPDIVKKNKQISELETIIREFNEYSASFAKDKRPGDYERKLEAEKAKVVKPEQNKKEEKIENPVIPDVIEGQDDGKVLIQPEPGNEDDEKISIHPEANNEKKSLHRNQDDEKIPLNQEQEKERISLNHEEEQPEIIEAAPRFLINRTKRKKTGVKLELSNEDLRLASQIAHSITDRNALCYYEELRKLQKNLKATDSWKSHDSDSYIALSNAVNDCMDQLTAQYTQNNDLDCEVLAQSLLLIAKGCDKYREQHKDIKSFSDRQLDRLSVMNRMSQLKEQLCSAQKEFDHSDNVKSRAALIVLNTASVAARKKGRGKSTNYDKAKDFFMNSERRNREVDELALHQEEKHVNLPSYVAFRNLVDDIRNILVKSDADIIKDFRQFVKAANAEKAKNNNIIEIKH